MAFSRAAATSTPHPSASSSMLPDHLELETPWQLNNWKVIQRSVSVSDPSSQLQHHNSFSAFFLDLLHSYDAPVRRVHSTGDLQRINERQRNRHSEGPVSSECSMIIEGMSKACRYSPEEKKVRIERYKSKRNRRNFNKKIKYACRKTLADSRPRIRGRFARNEEIAKNPLMQWSHIGGEEEDENWVGMFDSFVAANLSQESRATSSFGY